MIPFTKMHGIGNDFVMLDTIREDIPMDDLGSLAIAMNDRRFGVGGDGLILIEKGNSAPFKMRMFNPDGSESEMCGNGIRCFAKLLRDLGHHQADELEVETGAGILYLQYTSDHRIRVDMGKSRLTRDAVGMLPGGSDSFIEMPLGEYTATAVSMGNPHVVIFVDDVASIDLARVGPVLETNSNFPKRVNVHFVQVLDRKRLRQRTWERGAGITLACGTGACAVGVAGFVTGRTEREVLIDLPGGQLEIEYREDARVFMTGPAETVFTGSFFGVNVGAEEIDLAGIRETELLEHL